MSLPYCNDVVTTISYNVCFIIPIVNTTMLYFDDPLYHSNYIYSAMVSNINYINIITCML